MTRKFVLIAAVAAPTLMLAACGDGGADEADIADEANEEAPEEFGVAVDNIANELVPGADVDVPALQDIGEFDLDLGDTLGGCAFEHNGETLLIAGAEDDLNARGKGVIQVGGRDRLLAGTEIGGPEWINTGPTMTDGEYTVQVVREETPGEAVGVESTQWPAELVVRKDAANEVRYAPGTWTCGV